MKIGIDSKMFRDPNYTGIPRYVHEILRVWSEKYPMHEYYLYASSPIHLEFDLPKNWHIMIKKPYFKLGKIWGIIQLPQLIKESGVDVFWGPNYSLPPKVDNVKYFVTIYDIAILLFKNIGDNINEVKMRLTTKPSCQDAYKVVTISKSTADDVEKTLGIPSDKIEICYCGGIPESDRIEEICKLDIKEEYFLFVSTVEPRKNVMTIIKAFEKFIDRTGNNMKLIIAGKRGWKSDDVYEYYQVSRHKDRIHFTGYISDADKDYLYKNAKAFVYPSLYEGFGIPILEAFKYHLPVITTNVSSLPEVGGDAAFYINRATDVDELEQMMEKVITLSENEKNELDKKMDIQLSRFSWEKSADEMMRILNS